MKKCATCETWSKHFEETKGVSISSEQILKRLEKGRKFPETAKDSEGKIQKDSFYAEEDVFEVCIDLLMTIEEIRREAKDLLAIRDIDDRRSLGEYGSKRFSKANFHPFSNGIALTRILLKEDIEHISEEHFDYIVDVLNLPQFSEKVRQQYLDALKHGGISNRQTLINFGVKKFISTDFLPFGKGTAFATDFFGKVVKSVTFDHIRFIADTLFPKPSN